MKTTPIPVKFDRQGHSCNFYGGLGPTVKKYSKRAYSSPGFGIGTFSVLFLFLIWFLFFALLFSMFFFPSFLGALCCRIYVVRHLSKHIKTRSEYLRQLPKIRTFCLSSCFVLFCALFSVGALFPRIQCVSCLSNRSETRRE